MATPVSTGAGTSTGSQGERVETSEAIAIKVRAALRSTLSLVKKLMANKTLSSTVKGVLEAVGSGTAKAPLNVLKACGTF